MVAGQDAQAAGIDRQRLVQAELHGEIGHLHLGIAVGVLLEPGLLPQILGEFLIDHLEVGHEAFVGLERFQGGLLEDAQHLHRVVAGGLPQIGIQAAEEVDGVRLPAPPQVVGDALQCGQLLGQRRYDGEFVQHFGEVHKGISFYLTS